MSGVARWPAWPPIGWPSKRTCPATRPQAHDRAQRRRLAGAVAAEQHRHLAGGHRRGRRRAGCGTRRCGCARLAASSRVLMRRLRFRRDAQVGLLHDRRGDHRGRFAVGHQLAVVQHDDAVGQLAHHVHLVLDQQDGPVASRLQRADQVQDHRHLVDAHAGGRLVEHVDLGVQRHQQRHLELALVAVRQAAAAASALVGQAHAAAASRMRLVDPASRAVEPHATQVEPAAPARAPAPPAARSPAPSGWGTAASAGTRGPGRGACAPAPAAW